MKRLVLSLIFLISLTSFTIATVPRVINYQGKLLGSNQQPVPDGNYKLTFRIYDNSNKLLWTEVHNQVSINDGMFNVILGTITQLNIPFDEQYLLGIQVNNDPELQPKMRLTSAAYAIRAANSDQISGFSVSATPKANSLLPLRSDLLFPPEVIPCPFMNCFGDNGNYLLEIHNDDAGGIWGSSKNSAGISGSSSVGFGIEGWSRPGAGGVYGWSSEGRGVYGYSEKNDGVEGYTESSSKSGVYGHTNNLNGFGVFGFNSRSNNRGSLGSNNHGVYGESSSGIAVYANGRFTATGTKSAIVKLNNSEQVRLYSEEATEVYFCDYGEGQLANGNCRIELDPTFLQSVTVDEQHPMKVFVQLEGDCNGLFVTNKTSTSFEVIELQNGSSNAAFSYRAVCKRKYYEDERLATEEQAAQSNMRMMEAAWPEAIARQAEELKALKIRQEKYRLDQSLRMKNEQ